MLVSELFLNTLLSIYLVSSSNRERLILGVLGRFNKLADIINSFEGHFFSSASTRVARAADSYCMRS